MPDPWLTEKELEAHEKEVADHPLTKQAEEAKDAAKSEHEEYRKEQVEQEEKIADGDLVPVYSNGARTGVRDASLLSDEEKEEAELANSKPKEEGRDGAPENAETGPSGASQGPTPTPESNKAKAKK